jgi:hypothetical protein
MLEGNSGALHEVMLAPTGVILFGDPRCFNTIGTFAAWPGHQHTLEYSIARID